MSDVVQTTPETNRPDPLLTPRPDLHSSETAESIPAASRVERALGQCREWGRTRSEQARESIRAHPLRMGLGAVGAGVVLGMLLRR